jgi:hypothetical protein
MFLRIVAVDMDGFCGREHHPEPGMVGEIVRVVRRWVEDDVTAFTCYRSNGALVDLVEFEVRPIAEADGPFVIVCRVSGGVTGTRESLAKVDGVVRRFATRELAELEAAYLRSIPGSVLSVAYYQYFVETA